jgi:hypothetical protein
MAAVVLLVLHAGLLLWVSTRQSVTFDESFHLPAGVRLIARGDFITSYAQPPLVKSVAGAAALLAGARVPADTEAGPGAERWVGFAFMRDNADRFHRVYAAGRLPMILVSVALGWLVWRTATRWYGVRSGLLALAAYAVLPEPLAHGALVGVDVPTALTFLGAVLAFAAFARTGRPREWWVAAAWFAAAFLVRFSAVQLFPTCVLLLFVTGVRPGRRLRAWRGLAGLAGVAWAAIMVGYLWDGAFQPLGEIELHSNTFTSLQQALPALPVPFPEAYIRGLDYLAYLGTPGLKMSYFMGQVAAQHHVLYFPLALLVKVPVGLLLLVLLRAFRRDTWRTRRGRRRELTLLVPALIVLGVAMSSNLDYGVRYVLPMLPFLCVWIGGLWTAHPRAKRAPFPARPVLAWSLLVLAALETARAMPYPLAFFNLFAGGPGRGDRLVNDSNVDWGQGLVALRDELRRRGIRRVHLAYHGTVDPALYGIDYVPYTGGKPGPDSDWLAVSSYYFVGLPARMTTTAGQSEQTLQLDFRPLWSRVPDARPAHSIYLFRLR